MQTRSRKHFGLTTLAKFTNLRHCLWLSKWEQMTPASHPFAFSPTRILRGSMPMQKTFLVSVFLRASAGIGSTLRMSSSSEASLSPGDESDIEDFGNKTPAEKFRYQFQLIQKMRSKKDAPVDTMGCFSLHDRQAEPRVQRFQIFVSLLLSPRTRDEKTSVAVQVKFVELLPISF